MTEPSAPPIPLDATDRRILDALQRDAALTNHALAERVHVSPATCLRRVRRLTEAGVIERQVALLSPERVGAGITAIVEVTLELQQADRMDAFAARMDAETAVQQCYRVASGPDFVLVVLVADMAAYHSLAHRLFGGDSGVRTVRTYFAMKRTKFAPFIPLPAA